MLHFSGTSFEWNVAVNIHPEGDFLEGNHLPSGILLSAGKPVRPQLRKSVHRGLCTRTVDFFVPITKNHLEQKRWPDLVFKRVSSMCMVAFFRIFGSSFDVSLSIQILFFVSSFTSVIFCRETPAGFFYAYGKLIPHSVCRWLARPIPI